MTSPERMARGERHGAAKLTDADVVRMRALRRDGWKLLALALEFGVSEPTVHRACMRETWTHVP